MLKLFVLLILFLRQSVAHTLSIDEKTLQWRKCVSLMERNNSGTATTVFGSELLGLVSVLNHFTFSLVSSECQKKVVVFAENDEDYRRPSINIMKIGID